MALRHVISSDETAHYRPWLQQEQASHQNSQHWLCCWRAEKPMTSFLPDRSVPWAGREFYCHLQSLQPEARIVDITSWTTWAGS